MTIKAEIIADSLNEHGNRITTFVLRFPRIVLAEFNTHRMISKNSASSRAIPFKKMVEMVKNEPFIPIKWMKDHKGMQGNEYFEHPLLVAELESRWLQARDYAVQQAEILSEAGLTKQVVNRLLEPFMWHTVICTGTEWQNFFALRAHEAAEIHIQELAYKMLEAYNESTPKQLKAGEWHIPFGDKIDYEKLYEIEPNGGEERLNTLKIKIATARCARVSYLNFEGKDDYEADIKLHDNLASMGHFSPFEHCARAMDEREYNGYTLIERLPLELQEGSTSYRKEIRGVSSNFRGFIQYRKMLIGENKLDNRVNQHNAK